MWPVLVVVAQCFKRSSCIATLMDVHALWSLLDAQREGNSSCYYVHGICQQVSLRLKLHKFRLSDYKLQL